MLRSLISSGHYRAISFCCFYLRSLKLVCIVCWHAHFVQKVFVSTVPHQSHPIMIWSSARRSWLLQELNDVKLDDVVGLNMPKTTSEEKRSFNLALGPPQLRPIIYFGYLTTWQLMHKRRLFTCYNILFKFSWLELNLKNIHKKRILLYNLSDKLIKFHYTAF